MRTPSKAALLCALWLCGSAFAGADKLTILFTGDNGGEIAPCG